MVRINGSRVVFKRAERAEELPVGRPVTFGDKMALNQEASHFPEDISFSHTFQSKRKKLRIATIKIWKNMIFKGEKGFNSYDFPCLLIQIVVRNRLGNTVYKRPMWLSVYGAMRDEIMSELSTPLYFQRFDIEHFFRFGKQKLLLDSYHTPETFHGENMAEFTSLAYMQLFAAKDCAKEILYDWEKYQPKPEKTDATEVTPSSVLRDFSNIKKQAKINEDPPKPRGFSKGRKKGFEAKKRPDAPVIVKAKKGLTVQSGEDIPDTSEIPDRAFQPSLFEFMNGKEDFSAKPHSENDSTIIEDSGPKTYWDRVSNNDLMPSNYEIKFEKRKNQRSPPAPQMRPLF